MNKINLVFISHGASRSGAPILLWRLIRELVKNPLYSVRILLMHDGPLTEDFKSLAPVYFLNESHIPANTLKERALRRLGLKRITKSYRYRALVEKQVSSANVIFGNTVLSLRPIKDFYLSGKKIFFFLHELNFAVETLVTDEEVQQIGSIATKIFTPAEFVRQFFITHHKFPEDKVEILKYVKPEGQTSSSEVRSKNQNFRVGCCGSLEMRKGADIFFLIVFEIVNRRNIKDVEFYWVGINPDSQESILFKEDLRKTGLSDFVTLIPSVPDPLDHIKDFDLFVLPSREDPYPVVVQEAASLGVPTVYFKDAGGIGEFLKNGGIGVEYMNLTALCDQILNLKNSPETLQDLRINVLHSYETEPDAATIVSQLELAFNSPGNNLSTSALSQGN